MKKRIIHIMLSLLLLGACHNGSDRTEQMTEQESDTIYTCSMHPQVREHHPGNCPICHMKLAPVMPSGKMTEGLHLSEREMQLANIAVETVSTGTSAPELVLTATARANEDLNLSVNARAAGRIDRLFVKETGAKVSKGQPLYEIYSEDILATEKEYLLALESAKTLGTGTADFRKLAAAAKHKLLLWGLTEQQIARLDKNSSDAHVTILSPASGTVTDVRVTEGDYLMEGSPVLSLTDLSSLWVEAQLYPQEGAYLKEGSPVEVQFAGFPRRVPRKVSFISPELQNGAQLNLVRITLPNPKGEYQPGMQAYVYLEGQNVQGLTLPVDAILREEKGNTVWVQNPDGSFEPRMVRLGAESNGRQFVTSGIKPGEKVVTSGAYLLQSEYILKNGLNPHEGMKM